MTKELKQKAVCKKYGSAYHPSSDDSTLGISKNVRIGLLPVNGLRHPPENNANGWFIWAGEELSSDPNFFFPLHTKHISDWSKLVTPFLGLAPGWRFLVTNDYEDVWYDESLLDISS